MKLLLSFIALVSLVSCSKNVEVPAGHALIKYELVTKTTSPFNSVQFAFYENGSVIFKDFTKMVSVAGTGTMETRTIDFPKNSFPAEVIATNSGSSDWSVRIKNSAGEILKEGKPELVGGVYQVHITVQP